MTGVIVFLLIAIFCFYIAIKIGKNNKKRYGSFLGDNKITITKKSKTFSDSKAIIYDEKKNYLWIYSTRSINQKGFPIENITGCELIIDDETTFKTSLTSTAGRALVGGVLFGGVGAVIGGVTGKKKGSTLVKKIELIISTSDINDPYIKILVLNNKKGIKKDSNIFQKFYDDAMYWCKFIEALIKSNENATK